MTSKKTSLHGQWSSRWAFVLAATGSAVGLGNLWKFPYELGERGGAVFVLTYLVCAVVIGVPLMMAEIMMGRRGRRNLFSSMHDLADESHLNRHWEWLGYSMVIGGILILSFYSVIAGWSIAYIFRVASGMFAEADAAFSGQVFKDLSSDPERLLAWHTIFIMLTVFVVSKGVRAGLEKTVRLLMPALFVLLLIMVGYGMSMDGFGEAVRYMFVPDMESLKGKSTLSNIILPAIGHAFFTLSLGMGAIMIYGSYLSDRVSITKVSFVIAGLDVLVALLAGLAIFPIVFSHGLEPSGGPGLMFISLPVAFGHLPLGQLLGTLFFILVLIAAWSSAISLLEPMVNLMIERRDHTRLKASLFIGFVTWFLGLLTVLSFNEFQFDFKFLGQERSDGFFDILDILTTNIMLPLHGLLIALFVGWMMKRKHCVDEMKLGDGFLFRAWFFAVRYAAPIGVFVFFLFALGLITL